MQAHARMYEENKLEEKTMPIEVISWQRLEFEGSYKKSGQTYQDDILQDDSP